MISGHSAPILTTHNDLPGLCDTPVVHSLRIPGLRIQPISVALLLGEFFFDDILQYFMFQTQVCIHLFQAPVLLFQLHHPFHFTNTHPAILGFAEPVLAAQLLHCYSGFGFLQNVYDLAFRKPRLLMASAPGSLPRSVYFPLVLFYGRVTVE